MRRAVGALLALAMASCANSGISNFDLVVQDQSETPRTIAMEVVKERVEARACHITYDDAPTPTVGQVVAMAIDQAPGANALARVHVDFQVRHFRPWFFDRFCMTVRGDAVRVGE